MPKLKDGDDGSTSDPEGDKSTTALLTPTENIVAPPVAEGGGPPENIEEGEQGADGAQAGAQVELEEGHLEERQADIIPAPAADESQAPPDVPAKWVDLKMSDSGANVTAIEEQVPPSHPVEDVELMRLEANRVANDQLVATPTSEKAPIRIFLEKGAPNKYVSVRVLRSMTADDISAALSKYICGQFESQWVLREIIMDDTLERNLEDHERVYDVCNTWRLDSDSKLFLLEDYNHYEMFHNADQYVPDTFHTENETPATLNDTKVAYKRFLKMEGRTCSTKNQALRGFASLREDTGWTRYLFVLDESGLHKSNTDGTGQLHLLDMNGLKESMIYRSVFNRAGRIEPTPSTEYVVCIKTKVAPTNEYMTYLMLCFENEKERKQWMVGFRCFKFGIQLLANYDNKMEQYDKGEDPPCYWDNRAPSTAVRYRANSQTATFSNWNGQNSAQTESGQEGSVIPFRLSVTLVDLDVQGGFLARLCGRLGRFWPMRAPRVPEYPFELDEGVPFFRKVWYFPQLLDPRPILMRSGMTDGAFLVRHGENTCRVNLSFAHKGRVYDIAIMRERIPRNQVSGHETSTYWTLEKPEISAVNYRFRDINSLIEFYSRNQGDLPTKLTYGVRGSLTQYKEKLDYVNELVCDTAKFFLALNR